jgi:hypothetical protein
MMEVAMENSTTVAQEPAGTASALAQVALIPGENSAAYEVLRAQITEGVKPCDIIEEIWVRDVADLVWEILRLRCMKANLLSGYAHEGVREILWTITENQQTAAANGWAAREPDAIEHVEAALAKAGFTMDTVMALTLSQRLRKVERIERMIMAAEMRRNATLQEIRRHRAPFSERVRRTVADAELASLKLVAVEHAPPTAAP